MEVQYRVINKNEMFKIIDLWNKNIECLFPMDEKLFFGNLNMDENLKDENFIGAFCGEKLIGFIIFKQQLAKSGLLDADKTRGNINSLIVDFEWRNIGIGAKLLSICEQSLKDLGVKHIAIGSDTFHFFPGLPVEFKSGSQFLKARGYEDKFMSWDMVCDISKVDLNAAVQAHNLRLNAEGRYVTEELKEEDKKKLMDFFEKTFPGRWLQDTRRFFMSGMQCRDMVIVKDMINNTVIGFSHIYDSKSDVIGPGIYWRKLLGESFGGLGPIGIDKDYRKKDLGLTLLYRSLCILKERGVKKMCIDWTDLFDFYGIFNFMPWKGYMHMVKEISL